MALLVYADKQQTKTLVLPLEKGAPINLQRDDEGRWRFSTEEILQGCLAQVVRADNGFYAVVAVKEQKVMVNDIPVYGLHVLRNTDRIKIIDLNGSEQEALCFYEWVRHELPTSSKLIGLPCAFNKVPFEEGDHLIFCPKCDTPLHEYCWVARRDTLEGCVIPNCGYLPPKGDPYVPGTDEQKS